MISSNNNKEPAFSSITSEDMSRRSSLSSGSADTQEPVIGRPQQLGRLETGESSASYGSSSSSSSSSAFVSASADVDPLTREYPAPAKDIDVAEALAREPRKWTLRHYIQDTRDVRLPVVPSKEKQAEALAAAKRELLAASVQVQQLQIGGRE